MSDYAFHPEAFADIDQLWEYIAEHNIDGADQVVADIFDALRTLVASPRIGHLRAGLTTSTGVRCAARNKAGASLT